MIPMIGRGPAMELSFWAATDVGRKREINEDNFLVDKKLSLFVVADGMGGHAAGEVASQLAVHEFRNAVEAGREPIEQLRARATPSVRPQDILTLLEPAVQTAGQAVYQKGQAEPEKRGMGTTTLGAADRRATAASSPTSATAASTCCAPARSSSSPRTTRSSTS